MAIQLFAKGMPIVTLTGVHILVRVCTISLCKIKREVKYIKIINTIGITSPSYPRWIASRKSFHSCSGTIAPFRSDPGQLAI